MDEAISRDKVPCLPGRRRRRSRFLKKELRNRQFYDIVQTAVLYQRDDLLSELDPSDERYEELASAELSVVAGTSHHGARKLLAISGIYHNDSLWDFLRTCDGFKVFDETNFTKSYTSLRQGGGTFRLDFLESFVNGRDIEFHEKKLQKRRKLDAISLRFTAEARDACVTMYFKAMTIIPTLCSFMNIYSDINENFLIDILERYLSPSWWEWERQTQYHTNSYQVFLVDGWNLVNEIFKIQVQELCYWKDSQLMSARTAKTGTENGALEIDSMSARVTLNDLRANVHWFCQNLLTEFFGWCVNILPIKNSDCVELWGKSISVVDRMNEKMCKELGAIHTAIEIPEEKAVSLLKQIQEYHPTMAEMRYDAATLTPGRRNVKASGNWHWVPQSILMRCRWDDSPVQKHYPTFLQQKSSFLGDEKEEIRNDSQLGSASNSQPTTSADLERVPETPPKASPEVVRVPESPPRPAPSQHQGRAHSSRQGKRGYETDYTDRTAPSHHRKRAKASHVEQKSIRSSPVHSAPSFMDDGEASDVDERIVAESRNRSNDQRQVGRLRAGNRKRDMETKEEMTNLAIQNFYVTILDWPILRLMDSADFKVSCPRNVADMKAASNFINGNGLWMEFFAKSRRRFIQSDVTWVDELKMYQEHWKNILCIEVRGAISDKVAELLPTVASGKLPGLELDWTKDIPQERFLRTRVDTSEPGKGLFNLTCKSTSPSVNRRIAEELSGGTLCFAYIKSDESCDEDRGCTPLLLAICRRVNWEQEDVFEPTSEIDEIELHIVVSRARVRSRGIWPCDALYLFQVSAFSPYIRMFKAVQEAYRLPPDTRKALYGRDCPAQQRVSSQRRSEIDEGSGAYLDAIKRSRKLNESQFRAVSMVLENIGSCEANSTSLSLIQGPPGTGKTSVLPIIVGAIISHSRVGHLQHAQVNALKNHSKPDDILRHTTNEEGVRFLICCPSNQAMDNCLETFDVEGVPDGRGGTFKLQMVRLAKTGHKYGDLVKYSIDEKALPYDHFLFHSEQRTVRKHASAKAKKAFGRECIIAFCTNSTAGGDRLKSLNTSFDIIIQDEAGQALEPDTLIPATNVLKRSARGRCHQILSGDPEQLPAVSSGLSFVKKVKRWLEFDYCLQARSMFERLQVHNRAPVEMLDQQYRMHPCIAEMHSEIFYDGKVKSPVPAAKFKTAYNDGWRPNAGGLAPVTLIDTSKLEDRFEYNENNGVIMNSAEINIIDEILDKIKALSGAEFNTLQHQIALILPYRSQVDFAKSVLERYGKYVENGISRQGFRLTINTVDSMQGAERDVVIFAATRSNALQEVGFLDRPNRLNVAVSRARNLLVIIGDLSTMKACNSFGKFWDYCLQGRNTSALVGFSNPKNSRLATLERIHNEEHKSEYK